MDFDGPCITYELFVTSLLTHLLASLSGLDNRTDLYQRNDCLTTKEYRNRSESALRNLITKDINLLKIVKVKIFSLNHFKSKLGNRLSKVIV